MAKSNETQHSIQGSWRGKYFYARDPATPYGFEAIFIEILGIIEGNILDDGVLGEARVGGSYSYPEVRFTKVYMSAGKHPVKYQGTMSDDGKVITGRWVISGTINGTWVAMRSGEGETFKFEENSDELSTDKEEAKPMLAPMQQRSKP